MQVQSSRRASSFLILLPGLWRGGGAQGAGTIAREHAWKPFMGVGITADYEDLKLCHCLRSLGQEISGKSPAYGTGAIPLAVRCLPLQGCVDIYHLIGSRPLPQTSRRAN